MWFLFGNLKTLTGGAHIIAIFQDINLNSACRRDKDLFWPRLELAEICPLKERFASSDPCARKRGSLTKLRNGALMKSQAQGSAGEIASAPEGGGDIHGKETLRW
jgi:hypothetical protein